MKIRLKFGVKGLTVEVPEEHLEAVCRVRMKAPLKDPVKRLRELLENPTGAEPLKKMAEGRKSACVVICDHTRPVPSALLLPPVLQCLKEAGVSEEKTCILLATGGHRASTPEELNWMVGEDIRKGYAVVSHNARAKAEHTLVGEVLDGIPAWIDSRYVQAELKVIIGLIEPHLMAGYSGGRKMVCPGIASLETIRGVHSPALLEHPASAPGILTDNPVHIACTQAATLAGCDFCVNITQDDRRRITGIFAGDLHQSFAQGVEFVEQTSRISIAKPVDIVVTTGAGYPLDTTLYQAVKGLVAVLPIVKPGGSLLLAASLSEGLGSPSFCRIYEEVQSLKDFMQKITVEGKYWDDQWQVEEQAKAARKAEIFCYSRALPPEVLRKGFLTPVGSVESGLKSLIARYGSTARIAVVPDGPFVMPVVADNQQANR